jgi:hypothetical protein
VDRPLPGASQYLVVTAFAVAFGLLAIFDARARLNQ